MGKEIKSLEELLEERANQKPSDLRAPKKKTSFFENVKKVIQEEKDARAAARKAEQERLAKERKERASSVKTGSTSTDEEAGFEHVLNVFFSFKNTCPDKIIYLSISPSRRERGYVAFDIHFMYDGNIAWYPSNEANEMLQLFEMIKDEGSIQEFVCVYNTFEKSSNHAYIDQKVKSFVTLYMRKNPHIKFDLSGTGAKIKYW